MKDSKLIIHTIQDAVVVDFQGPSLLDSLLIDAIARELYELVDTRAARKIVLDFANVRFMASQAIGVLITLNKKAEAIKGQVAICNMNSELMKVFKIMNLSKVFDFYPSEKAALESMGVYVD